MSSFEIEAKQRLDAAFQELKNFLESDQDYRHKATFVMDKLIGVLKAMMESIEDWSAKVPFFPEWAIEVWKMVDNEVVTWLGPIGERAMTIADMELTRSLEVMESTYKKLRQ